jgi:hypothetical protein
MSCGISNICKLNICHILYLIDVPPSDRVELVTDTLFLMKLIECLTWVLSHKFVVLSRKMQCHQVANVKH